MGFMATKSGLGGRNALVGFLGVGLCSALFLGCAGSTAAAGGETPVAAKPQDLPTDSETGDVVEDVSFLDIQSEPSTEVLLDGKPIGKTPLMGVKVTPGAHDVTFVDESEGNRTMGVTVQPGDRQTVKLDRVPQIREQK